jgi:hypothetical protein
MNKDQTLTLPSGVEISFRVVRPDDAPALQRLHARCSERTIYLRFFGSMKKLSDEQARYFASTDGVDHFGLVALDPQNPNEIIAVVRYARKPGDERAEYAALVEDSWQGQGGRCGLDPSADRRSARQRGWVILRARKGREQTYAQRSAAPRSSRTRASGRWREDGGDRAILRR